MKAELGIAVPSASALVGTWRLISFDAEDRATSGRQPIFGTTPIGRLIILEKGLMMVILTAEGRSIPKTDEDRAKAFNTLFAYSGKYKIQGEQFSTDVDISWNEAWTGTTQVRSFRFVGSRLQLISAWAPSLIDPSRTVRGILEWEREA